MDIRLKFAAAMIGAIAGKATDEVKDLVKGSTGDLATAATLAGEALTEAGNKIVDGVNAEDSNAIIQTIKSTTRDLGDLAGELKTSIGQKAADTAPVLHQVNSMLRNAAPVLVQVAKDEGKKKLIDGLEAVRSAIKPKNDGPTP